MSQRPVPEIIQRLGFKAAFEDIYLRLFRTKYVSADSSTQDLEWAKVLWDDRLEKIASGDYPDVHPSQVKHWFLARFLISSPEFFYTKLFATTAYECAIDPRCYDLEIFLAYWRKESECEKLGALIPDIDGVYCAMIFLDYVAFYFDTPRVVASATLLGRELEQLDLSGPQDVFISQALKIRKRFLTENPRYAPDGNDYSAWLRWVRCWDMKQAGYSHKEIYQEITKKSVWSDDAADKFVNHSIDRCRNYVDRLLPAPHSLFHFCRGGIN